MPKVFGKDRFSTMFIYSVRASTVKFFSVLALSVITLIVLITLIPTYDSAEEAFKDGENITYSGVKTNEDRINFLSQFGWTVESEPTEEAEVTIPSEFDRVMASYNELQKQQGLNLEKYKRKKVTRYTYVVTNYPDYTGVIYANILVYRGKVIAGDICTADSSGFTHGLSGGQGTPETTS